MARIDDIVSLARHDDGWHFEHKRTLLPRPQIAELLRGSRGREGVPMGRIRRNEHFNVAIVERNAHTDQIRCYVLTVDVREIFKRCEGECRRRVGDDRFRAVPAAPVKRCAETIERRSRNAPSRQRQTTPP